MSLRPSVSRDDPPLGAAADAWVARRARYEAAFGQVYEPLQRYVLRRASAAVADDVVAEALTVLWRRLDEVPADLLLPWCYGVTRRCLANHRRGESRRDQLVEKLAAARVPPVAHEGGAFAGDEHDSDHELAAALALLGADDRELVRLWAWEELAPREIAVVLGVSANAVSLRLHRAKRRLAANLAGKNAAAAGHQGVGHTEEAR